jgi:predicted nucleic acid-binding protein
LSIAVDTNVIVYVVSGTPDLSHRAARALEEASTKASSLVISAVVYAELLALPAWTKADLDAFLAETKMRVDWALSQETWVEAGLAFARYAHRRTRQKAGSPRRLIADFVIGAHAQAVGGLLTADTRFYQTNFTGVNVLSV